MISLSHSNKLILFVIFFITLTFSFAFSEDEPVDLFAVNEFKNYLMTISSELEAEIAEIENLENDYYMQMSKKPKVYDLGE